MFRYLLFIGVGVACLGLGLLLFVVWVNVLFTVFCGILLCAVWFGLIC